MHSVCTTTEVLPATDPVSGAINKHFHYAFFRSMEATGRDWDAAAPKHDLFLQRTYLETLERFPPEGMRFGYLIFYKGQDPIGVAVCQIKYFRADESLQDFQATTDKEICFFSGLAKWFKKSVAGWVSSDILVCGSLLLTGEHAWYYDPNRIQPSEFVVLLQQSVADATRALELDGVKISIVLIKDLSLESPQRIKKKWDRNGYIEFSIQPNMVIDLHFADFDKYLAAMSTKYRTRYKRAAKKAEELEKRELNYEQIKEELDTIYGFYKEIATNSGFNMVDLNKEYLLGLKGALADQFKLTAYYLNGRMVSFYTVLYNGAEMDAHFLGYDKQENHDYQLYLNMLYDIIADGIHAGCKQIVFARTALEIKSSVGATPRELYSYVRHQNPVINHLGSTLLDYLKPVEEWQPRHPFK